jgi:hypothetical protein
MANWVVYFAVCRFLWVTVAVILIELLPTSAVLVDKIEKSNLLVNVF